MDDLRECNPHVPEAVIQAYQRMFGPSKQDGLIMDMNRQLTYLNATIEELKSALNSKPPGETKQELEDELNKKMGAAKLAIFDIDIPAHNADVSQQISSLSIPTRKMSVDELESGMYLFKLDDYLIDPFRMSELPVIIPENINIEEYVNRYYNQPHEVKQKRKHLPRKKGSDNRDRSNSSTRSSNTSNKGKQGGNKNHNTYTQKKGRPGRKPVIISKDTNF